MAKVGRLAEMGIFRATKSFFRDSESQAAKAATGSEPKVIAGSIPRKYRRELTRFAGPQGRAAMDTIEKYDVKVIFREGGGSLQDFRTNTIYIDVKNGYPTVQLIHEATHSRWAHEGRHADPSKLSRDDFIKQTLDEETDASVNDIKGTFELRKNGIKVPDAALQGHYVNGYENSYRWNEHLGKAQGKPLTYAELERLGDAGGRGAVNAAFHSGAIKASVTGAPYPQYYGDAWDAYQDWYRQYGQMS
ncbi:hypothetical protein [Actinoallomurus iriomotensis]|uniref:Uncharacterized protein n=1 Tax=Actinoallomurus iriomotensis TaxID=478107 RepID=A0A9W6RMG4_9ACTN|nr:hypothetical protein [Actinoallomurus iriomotensis]GLY78601.1 hypothetical protein Airi01_068680 [Actinoallomurus iriomotensis]